MNRMILFTFLFAPLLVFGQKTKRIKVKDEYKLVTEVYYVLKSDESVKHGQYQKLKEKEIVLINGFYKNGLKDSIWAEFSWDGTKLKSLGSYVNDSKIGVWEYYDFRGELEQKYDHTQYKLLYDKNILMSRDSAFTIIIGNDSIKTKLDHGPVYIGGSTLMRQPLFTLNFPEEAIANRISGKVQISFVVDKNGKAINHKVKAGIGYGCDEEALRVVKLIEDNWIPGQLNGKPVDVLFIQTVSFVSN